MIVTPVLVTGASTGIGEACALRLDRLGHRVYAGVRGSRVVIAGRDAGRLAAAAGRLGGTVRTAAAGWRTGPLAGRLAGGR